MADQSCVWDHAGCLTNPVCNSLCISLPPLKTPRLMKPVIALVFSIFPFHWRWSLACTCGCLCNSVSSNWGTPSLLQKCLLLVLDGTYDSYFFCWMSSSDCCYRFWRHWILSGCSSVPPLYWQWLLDLCHQQTWGKGCCCCVVFFFETVTLGKVLKSMSLCWSLWTLLVISICLNAYDVTCCHLLFNHLCRPFIVSIFFQCINNLSYSIISNTLLGKR